MRIEVNDDLLAAYADGELEPDTAAAVAQAVAADPALAASMAQMRFTRSITRQAFADTLSEPMPPALIAAIDAGRRPTRRPAWLIGGGAGFAAGVAAMAAVFFVFIGARPPTSPLDIAAAIQGPLETTISGQTVALQPEAASASIRLVATYPVPDGVCRSFALTRSDSGWLGLACRAGSGAWQLELLSAEPAVGFVPASSPATSTVDAFLDAVEAGESLNQGEEADLMARGWQVRPRAAD